MATCPECGAKYRDDVRVCEADGTALLPDGAFANFDEDLKAGDEVGEYRVDGRIGKGAFGAVYAATHLLIGKRGAIKVLASRHSSNQQTVSRFLSEARAVNQIRHKHIVDIFAFGALEDGRQYFIMELLEGKTLKEHLAERGSLTPAQALPLLRRIARALDAAHKAGIAHRDLKPDNVFLVFDEDGIFPKLLDFGVAKLLDDSATLHKTGTGTPMGTPLYMSPEQWRGKDVDHRSDIFSLGVMAFELLAGTRPFQGESPMDLMVKVATEEAPRLSSIDHSAPSKVDEAIKKMLANNPEDRPASATAAISALTAAYQDAGASMQSTFEPRKDTFPPPASGMEGSDGATAASDGATAVASSDGATAAAAANGTNEGVSQTLEERPANKPYAAIAVGGVAAIGLVVLGMSLGGDGSAPQPTPAATGPAATAPAPSASATAAPSASQTAVPTATATATASATATETAKPAPRPVVPRPVAPKPKPGPKDRPIIPVLER